MFEYYYNDDHTQLFRQHRRDVISIKTQSISRVPLSFKEECQLAAERILEKDTNIWLGLTGGWYSNIILDSFLEIGFKPNVFIMELNGITNYNDTSSAIQRCKELNIEPLIIEAFSSKTIFPNLLKFGTRVQIYSYYESILASKVRLIPGRAVIADQLNVRRDVHPEGKWSFIVSEDQSFWSTRYNQLYPEKRVINNFFTSSPEILLSFLESEIVSEITDGSINGKLSLNSSKNKIFNSEGFTKENPYPVTIGTFAIPDVEANNSELAQTTMSYYSRDFYFELAELKRSLRTEDRIWKFV